MSGKTNFVFKAIVGIIAMVLLVSAVVMALWNWLMPEIFGLGAINYLQALGLLLLSKIFFGGGGAHLGKKWKGAWMDHMQNRMEAMSPEEREKFRQQWEARCGKWKREV